ncbi:helix-turn-helix transcriptional regulator [Natronosporangium hydrolyticum]|uniref:Helix-turn-helix transcriptional regulator n=1 Tax=Natronosporangium hydrolyticum TaxID=2811111 RepID=A0A895YF74_9ACTN|nr:LuxR family transcriptional regulator [Natronosporangium hydrolyticum]QSB16514.1 helix-turn-helix transcriptional regulator [Natronosporangium hydrolyticum]
MANEGHHPIRIVVHSDRRLGREAIVAYLAQEPDFTVVGHTGTAHGLRSLCALGRPTLCLVDVPALTTATVRMLQDLRVSFPTVTPLVVYGNLTLEMLAAALQAGVPAFTPSSRGLLEVVRLLRQLAAGPAAGGTAGGAGLTERELGVISLLSTGHSVSDIAHLLQISPHTVDNHKRRLFAKLHADSQQLVVSRAAALGLLEADDRQHPAAAADPPELTVREQQILALLARGRTIRQVGRALGIAAKTVENTQTRLYRKLGTHNRAETLAVAFRVGLLDPATTDD